MSSHAIALIAALGAVLCCHCFAGPLTTLDANEPNALFAMGGYSDENRELKATYLYNATANSWTPRARMTTVRAGFAAATLDNIVYAIGDHNGGLCERYTPAANGWKAIKGMHGKRLLCAAVAFAGSIIAYGGSDGHHYLSSAEQYIVATDEWRSFPNLTVERFGLAGVALGECIYAFGGWKKKSAEMYCTSTQTWDLIASMSQERFDFSAAATGGFIYACGGSGSSSCERYDPATNAWKLVSPMPRPRDSFGMAVLQGKIYVVGGKIGNQPYGDVFSYNATTDKWHQEKSLWSATKSLALVPIHV